MANVVRLPASGQISFKEIAENADGGLANVAMNIYGALYNIISIDNNNDSISEFHDKCACVSTTFTNNNVGDEYGNPPFSLYLDYTKCDGTKIQGEELEAGYSITRSIIRLSPGGGADITTNNEDC